MENINEFAYILLFFIGMYVGGKAQEDIENDISIEIERREAQRSKKIKSKNATKKR